MSFDITKLTPELISTLSEEERYELMLLLEDREEYMKNNWLEFFQPYKFQEEFYTASKQYKRRFLCAANRVGKSFSEAIEMAAHLTGIYPEWWEGHRFDKPILAWAIGISSESTQNVLQKELFGTSHGKDKTTLGTGSIPRKCIDFENLVKDGHRIISCKIKHFDKDGLEDGYSVLQFKSTAQGEHVLMGATVDYIWMDEEDPHRSEQIYAQCVTRTATTGGLITITATPENGLTSLVDLFMKGGEDADGIARLYFQNATWDDAPHLDDETKKELLASIPEWQHDMRTRGIPIMGEGLIYAIDERTVTIPPFEIPSHWKRVCGVDIGITHPTAAVWSAYDPATDTIYVYDVYHGTGDVPALHATAINERGNWIPVVLPHDADNTERGSGKTVATYYREAGVNAMLDTFYNPIGFDGKQNNFVEPGIMEINQRMKTGRFKIFSHCGKIFEEMRRYHRKDGRIVKTFDDALDAMRYSAQSVTHRGISEGEAGAGYSAAYQDNWSGWERNY
ncbi:terminase large subunit [Vibrio phage vB_VpaP_SJSY21]|nr:terminase large subunit [Vibrio phage vB_VpaP_SJSY21]